MPREAKPKLTFAPATPDRWDDIAALLGPRGQQARLQEDRRGRSCALP